MKSILNFLKKTKYRHQILVILDMLCLLLSFVFYYLVADHISGASLVGKKTVFLCNAVYHLSAYVIFRYVFRVYHTLWRYTNPISYLKIVIADGCAVIAAWVIARCAMLFSPAVYIGVWVFLIPGLLACVLSLTARFLYAVLYAIPDQEEVKAKSQKKPVAIVGAGKLGFYIANDLGENPNSEYDTKFFIDDDERKIHSQINGLAIYSAEEGQSLIQKDGIKNIIVAISSIDKEKLRVLYDKYTALGCRVSVVDSIMDSASKDSTHIREFTIEDLLFRDPIHVEGNKIFYENRTVLVTGGGGSIGSELCRQIALCHPKRLIVFDIYENNAYDIQMELREKYGDALDLCVEIGSVRDRVRLEQIFAFYKPEIVFHAAAHKHVPLMEHSSAEAIKNNVMGTRNTADMAEKYGVAKFILISTDKAVNPTNIMGASKRLCEMVVQCRTDSKTSFAAVRFGNVLGSNGSVIPLFRRQIEKGGPVTITDKRIIRYFMTIPEASRLVMCAGSMAKPGDLFVLDMGKPVHILELAENMIKLYGMKPYIDIDIREIGLRPGEKLFEELLMKNEQLEKTDNQLIFIEHDKPYTRDEVNEKLRILSDAVEQQTSIKDAIKSVVPTFREPEEVNRAAAEAEEMKQANAVS